MASLNTDINTDVMANVRPNMKLNLDDPIAMKEQEGPRAKKKYVKSFNLNMKKAAKWSGYGEYEELEYNPRHN